PPVARSPYWLTRFVLLRLLGFVYGVAFLCLAQQLLPLLGEDGLTPVTLFLHRLEAHFGSRRAAFLAFPSLFWLDASDGFMLAMAWLGAGLIKLRGDSCWRHLTCLYYHYETQPLPNPLSRWFHFKPHWFQKGGVLFNYLAELAAPWFAFWPRAARHVAGGVLLAFQVS